MFLAWKMFKCLNPAVCIYVCMCSDEVSTCKMYFVTSCIYHTALIKSL